MIEKRWIAVPPQLFIVDGGTDGKITVSNTTLFKVKQVVSISAPSLLNLELEIKRITDLNTIHVGPISGSINLRTDVSQYTVILGSFIFANEQLRSKIPEQEIERLTYEEEPVVARRIIPVDRLGNTLNGAVNGGVPSEWDDVQLAYDMNQNLSVVRFYLNSVLLTTGTATYDMNQNLTNFIWVKA